MKKSIIAGLLGVLIVCLVATGCMFNKALNAKDFKEHFESLKYTVTSEKDEKFNSSTHYIVNKEDSDYSIEYYEFDEEIDAKKAYQNYKENISSYITSQSENQETTGAIFSKIVCVSEKEYIIISRVKNTLIFVNATNDVSKEIDSILEDIKY